MSRQVPCLRKAGGRTGLEIRSISVLHRYKGVDGKWQFDGQSASALRVHVTSPRLPTNSLDLEDIS